MVPASQDHMFPPFRGNEPQSSFYNCQKVVTCYLLVCLIDVMEIKVYSYWLRWYLSTSSTPLVATAGTAPECGVSVSPLAQSAQCCRISPLRTLTRAAACRSKEVGGKRAPAHLRHTALGCQLPVANCSCLSNGDDVTSCFGCYCCQSNPNTLKH